MTLYYHLDYLQSELHVRMYSISLLVVLKLKLKLNIDRYLVRYAVN